MDTNNPVIKLCIQGVQAEFDGRLDVARDLYQQAWDISQDDYEGCIAAHYVARFQDSPEDALRWNQEALKRAGWVNNERVKEFYPSLYLSLGRSQEILGNPTDAQKYFALAAQLGVVHQEQEDDTRFGVGGFDFNAWPEMTKTHPTPYPELNVVLQMLVESAASILGDNFLGAYLQGSFAVGDYDRHSDVDWIIAIQDELSTEQIQALRVMHEVIFDLECPWAQHLEGSYFPKDVLRGPPQRGKLLWYIDNGSRTLVESEHCNTLVVRWQVRQHGIALAGPPARTLIDPIPVNALRQEIFDVIHDWGKEILADPEHYNNRFYQGFIVLSYARMLHSLHTGEVRSKHSGAEWAKANLDPSWAGLIDRSWVTRPNPEVSVRQPADPQDLAATLDFVRYCISLSEQAFFDLRNH